MQKVFYPNKQRKLAHILAYFGHGYLLKNVITDIQKYLECSVKRQQDALGRPGFLSDRQLTDFSPRPNHTTLYRFLNSVDIDFSTPLILALKNNRQQIVKLLLNNERICLRQSSLRYGTPLHISILNEDYKNALKIIKALKKSQN